MLRRRSSANTCCVAVALLYYYFAQQSSRCRCRLFVEGKQQQQQQQQKQQCDSKDEDPSSCSAAVVAEYTTMGSYELMETVPHDPKSFTQGLEIYNTTHMYESSGLYKKSSLRLVEISTGKVVKETKLEDRYFAEGLTRCLHSNKDKAAAAVSDEEEEEEQLIVLTWMEQTAFVVDPDTLEIRSDFAYKTTNNQGWGVACDKAADKLFVTDGTSFLHLWNATTRNEISKVQVSFRFHHQPGPQNLNHINELELDSNSAFLLANVWYQDVLVQIHADTGFVHTVYDLSTLRPKTKRGPTEDCLNGIARVSHDIVWVTGKQWPFMYKIRLLQNT